MMSAEQDVFLPNGSKLKVPNKNLAATIMDCCIASDVYDVHLIGNPNFLKRLENDLYIEEGKKFSEAKLSITIIGGNKK